MGTPALSVALAGLAQLVGAARSSRTRAVQQCLDLTFEADPRVGVVRSMRQTNLKPRTSSGRSFPRIVAAVLMSGECVGDLQREGVDACDIRHVGGGGNRETEIRERQE